MPAFFADECVAGLIVQALKEGGFDIVDAKTVCRGDSDDRVLSLAAAAGRVVITNDWGFGEMTVRHGQPATGVIILSLFALTGGTRETYAAQKISEIADKATGHLTIIEPGRIRRRPLQGL